MTDLRDPSPAAPSEPPPDARDASVDPLASLHKMSTTAGITSQEYVAINIPSILAAVLGLASLLPVVFSPILMLVPVAAVVVAWVALSQIKASNGTQTGRGFAWLGIVLALALGGFVVVRGVLERSRTAADRETIVRQIEELGRHVSAKEYDAAYAMFGPRFHNRVDRPTFEAVWEQAQSSAALGHIQSMRWNQTSIFFESDPGSGTRVATAYAWVKFDKSNDMARHPLVFRKSGGNWVIDDAPVLFPGERRRPTRRPPGSTPAAPQG
jgi:hypothetical protein